MNPVAPVWVRLEGGYTMKSRLLRTPQDVRTEWLRKGTTQNDWARKNGFSPASVSQVLNGRNSGARGVGHKIAVMLGIKEGEIVEDEGHDNA